MVEEGKRLKSREAHGRKKSAYTLGKRGIWQMQNRKGGKQESWNLADE